MIVLKSTYDELRRRYEAQTAMLRSTNTELQTLTMKWNGLVNRINALGGEQFLQSTNRNGSSQFSREEIKQLVRLCHPDKHNGSKTASAITAKLLTMQS